MLETLSHELRRMSGVQIEVEEWNLAQIPPHLRMTFRVIDEKGGKIAESLDLDQLKFSLKDKVQKVFPALQIVVLNKAVFMFGISLGYRNFMNRKNKVLALRLILLLLMKKIQSALNYLKQSLNSKLLCSKDYVVCCY